MNDPTPTAINAEPAPALASAPLRLAERYPAYFDWEQPRPLKINIHQDLIYTGLIPRSLLCSLVTQYPAACCGVVYSRQATTGSPSGGRWAAIARPTGTGEHCNPARLESTCRANRPGR